MDTQVPKDNDSPHLEECQQLTESKKEASPDRIALPILAQLPDFRPASAQPQTDVTSNGDDYEQVIFETEEDSRSPLGKILVGTLLVNALRVSSSNWMTICAACIGLFAVGCWWMEPDNSDQAVMDEGAPELWKPPVVELHQQAPEDQLVPETAQTRPATLTPAARVDEEDSADYHADDPTQRPLLRWDAEPQPQVEPEPPQPPVHRPIDSRVVRRKESENDGGWTMPEEPTGNIRRPATVGRFASYASQTRPRREPHLEAESHAVRFFPQDEAVGQGIENIEEEVPATATRPDDGWGRYMPRKEEAVRPARRPNSLLQKFIKEPPIPSNHNEYIR